MPPRHQGDTQTGAGDDHGCHSAMDRDKRCNQVKFLLTMIQITG
jgi:hypothetical protein